MGTRVFVPLVIDLDIVFRYKLGSSCYCDVFRRETRERLRKIFLLNSDSSLNFSDLN